MGKALMPFEGNLLTTGMGILPHREIERALTVAMSVDIPFWPQLPKMNYFEDMYVQASENFPGIIVEPEERRISFSTEKFYGELENALLNLENEDFFRISPQFSGTYHRFLSQDLSTYVSIRGQLEGPVSFGLNVLDENKKQLIFNDEARPFLFDFMARKANCQLHELKAKNPRAFLFIDEPGLQYLFSALSGYTPDMARTDYEGFFARIEHPRGIHLCGNPDWDFLLQLDIDILSFNAFNCGEIFVKYREGLKRFLDRGGMLGWGLVPANTDEFNQASPDGLIHHIESLWRELEKAGFDLGRLLSQSILMPATCALMNLDGFDTVEAAYDRLQTVAQRLRATYLHQ
ncbi:MAG: uroporphyrinogen decarboxylase/cobalamine-independent methonine synthase family protein [Syntrophales bacterium]